jgi:peptidoglycan hydrolase CwlO-like protein
MIERKRTFDENVLLRIRRQYSKDEAVGVLIKELSDAKFKNGELLSEIAELKDQIEVLKHGGLNKIKKKKKEWLKDDVIKSMHEEKLELQEKLRQKNREVELWMGKYYSTKPQVTKLT